MEQNQQEIGEGVEPITGLVSTNSPPTEEPKVEPTKPEQPSMESLLGEEGLNLDFPNAGEVRTGVIASIGENEILVSVGTKSEGVISGRELESISDEEREQFEIGAKIPVYVIQPEDNNGNVVLSYNRAREQQDWEKANELLESAEPFETEVVGFNKGGLLVPLGMLRGFVPASQVGVVRRASVTGDTPEERWGVMMNENITVRVIEVDRERRRLILSERLALQETRETLKDRLLDELKEGEVRTGRVTSLAEFGAFVNIDGADGLVHLSEISWERIQHPNEVLKVGQEVQVKVIGVDREKKRIGLSLRQLQDDPWLKKIENLREGQLVEASITHLTKFGAFARLSEEIEGLIHLSELSEQRINHPKEAVKEGEVVTLRIIKIDAERRRIALSMRKVDSPAYADLDWKMALADEVEGVRLVGSDETEAVEEAPAPEQDVAAGQEMDEKQAEPVTELEATLEEAEEAAEQEAEEIVAEAVDEVEATLEEAEEAAEQEAEQKVAEAVDEVEALPEEAEEAAEQEIEQKVAEKVDEVEALPEETEEAAEQEIEQKAAEAVEEVEQSPVEANEEA
jgi:small subunit ribosomal protein S1